MQTDQRAEARTRSMAPDAAATWQGEGITPDVVESLPIGVLRLSPAGVVLTCNRAACAILGRAYAELRGRALFDMGWGLVDGDGQLLSVAALPVARALTGGRAAYNVAVGMTHPEKGEQVWLSVSVTPHFTVGDDAEGAVVAGALCTVADITGREQARLRDRFIIESATNSIVISDPYQPDCPIVYANPAFVRATGYAVEEIIGRNCRFLQGPDTDPAAIAEMRAAVAEQRACTVTLHNYRKDSSSFWQELTVSPVRDAGGRLLHFIGIQTDITELKRAEEALTQQALHDALTGLPNRVLLLDRLEQSLRVSRREGTELALLLLDLDRFKEVNDTFGHHYGDLLLGQVGERLRGLLRELDTVARLGGDEFAVLLPGTDTDGARTTAAKILQALERPFVLEGHGFDIGGSIGVALAPAHGTDATALMRRADVAMYTAKGLSSGAMVYAPDQDQYSPGRLALIGELRHAIEEDELVLHYQPKVDVRSGDLDGVETLVRWQHPVHGMLLPDKFIPLAEHTGLIKPLSLWVLRAALRQCRAWHDANLDIRVAVNVSARLLQDEGLVETVTDMLRTADVPPDLLQIEITESAVMADPAGALRILTRLHEMGIRIAIDDFGTGYSSLSYLKKLPVDEIKIDKSFVLDMSVNADDVTIARSIIDLGHNLGMGVVAEGVEHLSILNQLADMGCDLAQGYYVSKPIPAADLTAWARAWDQSEVGSRKSEVGSRKSEVGSRKSEVGSSG